MFRNLLIAGLAILLTACVPIPTEEPPTPVPTPQMQASLDDFASLFAAMDFPNTDDADISEEKYKNAILELRDCLMSAATPEQLQRWTSGEVAAIEWYLIFLVLVPDEREETHLIIDLLEKGATDCQAGAWD